MVMLEVPIAIGDRRYAVRPPPRARVRPRQPPETVREAPDVIGWSGNLPVLGGCTPGGDPYGPSEDAMELILDPADLELLQGDTW